MSEPSGWWPRPCVAKDLHHHQLFNKIIWRFIAVKLIVWQDWSLFVSAGINQFFLQVRNWYTFYKIGRVPRIVPVRGAGLKPAPQSIRNVWTSTKDFLKKKYTSGKNHCSTKYLRSWVTTLFLSAKFLLIYKNVLWQLSKLFSFTLCLLDSCPKSSSLL
jgi:hypothetical protein